MAVCDPLPMFRAGVAAVLGKAGHQVADPDDVGEWLRTDAGRLVLLTLHDDRDWTLLSQLGDVGPVVAVIEDGSPADGLRAFHMGAASVLVRRATSETVIRAVEATADGQCVLPAAVANAVLARTTPPAAAVPGAERVDWLRQLAAGSTVAALADRTGYSERAMYRMLRQLYHEMAVGNRLDAIVTAKLRGWL